MSLFEWFGYKFLLGRCDWYWSLLFRYRCPYPIINDRSAKACVRAGHCGCDNFSRYQP